MLYIGLILYGIGAFMLGALCNHLWHAENIPELPDHFLDNGHLFSGDYHWKGKDGDAQS